MSASVATKEPRQLSATLPYGDSWNTWWDWYGNTADGFAARDAEISAAAQSIGRDPGEIERGACVLAALDS